MKVLEAGADSHDRLARLQSLAFVFDSEEDVARVRDRELASLSANEVTSASALKTLAPVIELAEVLRAAAELEMPRLSPVKKIDPEIEKALHRVVVAAPKLQECTVRIVRPLGLRGRVLDSLILVGAPGIEADAEHIAWQAAHEATVVEVGLHDWTTTERRAIGLLRSRARAAGLDLADSHARWLSRFDLSALGSIPDIEDAP